VRVARVTGEVVSTVKHPALRGWKLLVIAYENDQGELEPDDVIALDSVDAGVGDRVLVNDEGGGAAQVMESGRGPVRTMIVGIVDDVSRTRPSGDVSSGGGA